MSFKKKRKKCLLFPEENYTSKMYLNSVFLTMRDLNRFLYPYLMLLILLYYKNIRLLIYNWGILGILKYKRNNWVFKIS